VEDGSPVTSRDVAYTIERVRDPKVPVGNWRPGFEDVAAVETPDAHT
jgi:ABC-type transport system substrate-binding protein